MRLNKESKQSKKKQRVKKMKLELLVGMAAKQNKICFCPTTAQINGRSFELRPSSFDFVRLEQYFLFIYYERLRSLKIRGAGSYGHI